MANFGEKLRQMIKAKHLGVEEFAKNAGLGADTLYRNLRSSRPVGKPATYRTIASSLGMTTQQLDEAWKTTEPSEPRRGMVPRELPKDASPSGTAKDVGEHSMYAQVIQMIQCMSEDELLKLAGAAEALVHQRRNVQNDIPTNPARTAGAA